MRLEDMLKNVSGITNRVIKENCWDGQFNVLEGIQVLQSKINEIILAINNGIIKGDKGDTPNVQVGKTTTLEPGNNASVTQTGDMLNPIFNFEIPKGDKGDKGDTGKASESIQDNVVGLDTCWSSQKTVGYVDNVFNSLQDVKGVKYVNDKEYFVASGSKNGVVKDIKISGRSLVNLCNVSRNFKGVSNGFKTIGYSLYTLKNNMYYTFVVKNKSNNDIKIYSNENLFVMIEKVIKPGETTIFRTTSKDVFNEPGDTTGVLKLNPNGQTSVNVDFDFMLLEGDFTQNPPHYFEGIASVGNGNEIEVLSLNQTINYKDKYDSNVDGSYYFYQNGTKYDVSNMSSYNFKNNNYGVIKLVGKYTTHITFFNGNSFISGKLLESPLFDEIIKVPSNCTEIRVGCRNDLVVPNIYLKQDKKPILFKDTDGAWKPITELRGIDTNSCDIIDSTVNKLYKKYDKIILNGSENIVTFGTIESNDTISFAINDIVDSTQNPNKANGNFISDRLPYKDIYANNDNTDGMNIHLKSIRISVMKSKLETQDVTGFKKWLQSNPITIIYQLAQEKIYEVNPLDLQSFENETMILFKYGLVNGKSEFYVDSNLGSITIENMERLSRIENEIYQVKKVVLNGDYRTLAQSTYPEDFKEVVKYE